jgi:monofunctional biosynthetic peptidoglycan transglycosylase
MQNALEDALRDRELPRGASTITQQLAKNLWLSPSRNPLRKGKEALLTWQLERALSKRRILEIYLNVVELGPGIYGVGAASQRYFGRHPPISMTARRPSSPPPCRIRPCGTPARPARPTAATRRPSSGA